MKVALFVPCYVDALFPNVGVAYRKLSELGDDAFGPYGFGTFISGPSKTADIAQVLVMGAQAARSVTVLLVQ